MVLPDRPLCISEDGWPRGPWRRSVLAGLFGMIAGFTARTTQAQIAPHPGPAPPGDSAPGDSAPGAGDDAAYASPYALGFSTGGNRLNAGFDQLPWNDPAAEPAQPVADWQAAHARLAEGIWPRGAAWGPPASQYPAPSLPGTDPAYLRERVIAVAARHIGLAYQHHHIPSWVPPPGWAWRPVAAGTNGPGLDCSNFTSFVFNYALGIKLPTGIGLQGGALTLTGPGGAGCLRPEAIPLRHYAALGAVLAPADLIYIRDRSGRIVHVVMWLGATGRSPDGDPLVIDCSQTRHRDANGVMIPPGVRLRPFRQDGWYWRHVSHARRIIGAGLPACHAPPGGFPEGGDAG
jgi:cell wall-associated NlpC family hydrolase